MARGAREISVLGLYHVILRGVAQQVIFYEDQERIMFLKKLEHYSSDEFQVLAYCLMDNHIHMVVKTDKLSEFLKSIGVSFVWWYNTNNERSGHLYQNRFVSEAINDEQYLLRCVRYIHNNPVKAKICSHPYNFSWSSSVLYFANHKSFVNTEFLENLFVTREDYMEYMGLTDDKFNERAAVNKIGYRHLEHLVFTELNEKNVFQLSKEEKIEIAQKLISNYNLNKKQLSKLLAMPYKYLFKH